MSAYDYEDMKADAAELAIKLRRGSCGAIEVEHMVQRYGPLFRTVLGEYQHKLRNVHTGTVDVAAIHQFGGRSPQVAGRRGDGSPAHARPGTDAARTPASGRKGRASPGRTDVRAG